jgi:MFS family permease
MAISSIGEGFFGSIFWVFVDEELNGGTREAGWLMSAQAVGGLLGSLAVGNWARGVSPVRLLGWGAIGLGIADLGLFNYPAFASGIWLGLIFLCLAGFPVSAFSTGFTTIIQTEAGDAYRGRVFGALSTTMGLLMIFGASIAGPLTERFGSVIVLSVQAAAYPVAGVLALTAMGEWGRSRTRRLREESLPTQPDDHAPRETLPR